MMQLEICLKMKERPHENVATMISFFARNRGADWSSELISNFLHGLGIGGGGGGDHLELEPRIFATLHFTKKGPLCSKFYIIRFCSEFPVFLYVCLKNKKKNEIAKFSLNFRFGRRSKRKE